MITQIAVLPNLPKVESFFARRHGSNLTKMFFFQEKKWLWIVLLTRSMQSYQLLEKFLPKMWKFFAKHPKKRNNLSMKKFILKPLSSSGHANFSFDNPTERKLSNIQKCFERRHSSSKRSFGSLGSTFDNIPEIFC